MAHSFTCENRYVSESITHMGIGARLKRFLNFSSEAISDSCKIVFSVMLLKNPLEPANFLFSYLNRMFPSRYIFLPLLLKNTLLILFITTSVPVGGLCILCVLSNKISDR